MLSTTGESHTLLHPLATRPSTLLKFSLSPDIEAVDSICRCQESGHAADDGVQTRGGIRQQHKVLRAAQSTEYGINSCLDHPSVKNDQVD
jgi:hypothetical protein